MAELRALCGRGPESKSTSILNRPTTILPLSAAQHKCGIPAAQPDEAARPSRSKVLNIVQEGRDALVCDLCMSGSKVPARTKLLAESWTAVAQQYEKRLAPLFQPWLDQLVGAIGAEQLPEGPLIVPACGPGIELLMLAKAVPGERQVIGIDLAQGMVDIANERIGDSSDPALRQRVRACVGDACKLPNIGRSPALIFSCFGLQQMPEPQEVLLSWLAALAPGGLLAVAYWPPADGQREIGFSALTDPELLKGQDVVLPGWDRDIAARMEDAGGSVLLDDTPSHSMSFKSPADCFEVMMEAGPLHSRLLRYGPEHMQALKASYCSRFKQTGSSFSISPNARRLLVQRLRPISAL